MAAKLTHADKDRIIDELRTTVRALESKLQAAKVQHAPPAQQSINAIQRDLLDIPPGSHKCAKCQGTGKVALRNGDEGDCYRCRGKGYMSPRDQRRFDTYELHRELDTVLDGAERWAAPGLIPIEAKRGRRLIQHNGWWYIEPFAAPRREDQRLMSGRDD